jgi:hypothetical protein
MKLEIETCNTHHDYKLGAVHPLQLKRNGCKFVGEGIENQHLMNMELEEKQKTKKTSKRHRLEKSFFHASLLGNGPNRF